MKRRTFLRAVAGTAIASPIRVLAARDPSLPLVAVLIPGQEESSKPRIAALLEGMKSEGLVEGSHYSIEARFANGDFARLPELARELDALSPRLFVASANAVLVVHKLLPDRPLVFTAIAADPIAFGLAQSYTRPGGAATGNVMNAVGGEQSLTAKRLGFFKDLVPNLKRLGMIGSWAPDIQGGLLYQEEVALRTASDQLGFTFAKYSIKTREDIEQAFAKALADSVDALYISGDPFLFANLSHVMPHILAAGKPTLGAFPEWARAGLLLSYSNDLADGFRRAGMYAARIIRGAKPGDLPIDQASKFTLAINLKTAKQLGISVPPNLLAVADELVE